MATRIRLLRFWVLSFILVTTASVAMAGKPVVQVSSCNQFIFDSTASLTNDLYCGDTPGMTLRDSDLIMNGFTITAGSTLGGVVHCRGRCHIVGPGTIVGGSTAITGTNRGRIFVDDVVMRDSLSVGVNVAGETRITLTRSSIENSAGCAYIGETLILRESTITGNECGIWSTGGLRVVDSTIADNLRTNTTGSNFGVLARRPRILRSTLTGNGVDVRSNERPAFKNSTCETSLNQPYNSPWGICSLDP